MKNIIWVGPDLPVNKKLEDSKISAAAYYWQSSFKNALVSNGVNLISISYEIDRIWPFGKLFVRANKFESNSSYFVSYLNIYKIREIWIAIAILTKSFKFSNYDVITYNSLSRNIYFILLRKKLFKKTEWYSILADDYVKFNPDFLIFLSYGYYKTYKHNNKYHFNGALDKNKIFSSKTIMKNPNILLYSGAISEWTGINDFVEIFSESSNLINWELHIYGKGDISVIKKYINSNKKIKYFGFVEEQALINAARIARAFINPRPINIASGENNFPSKLMFYLSFGKYIISTKTEGLSPEFDSLLIYSNFDHPYSLKEILLNIENEKYQNKLKLITDFQLNNTWEKKVAKLLSEIK